MRVLLTNNTLTERAGSELYLRDVALELMRRGHHPVAYSTRLGAVAAELQAATIPVIDRLDSLGETPDIIHGQHHYETLSAMLRFPQTPAISYCHGWLPFEETPLSFPRIMHYVAVDELCRERLIVEGSVPPERILLLFNFFDVKKFPPRGPLPEKPLKALVFGNAFAEDSDLPLLREACGLCGIELDVAGLGVGKREADPGQLFQSYDIVFAKARAAIEAMAVGTAVILCHPGRLGPLITPANFARLRPLNFGVRTLDRPLDLQTLLAEIERYNPDDAMQVAGMVRSQCELQPAMDRLIRLYERVIQEAEHTAVDASCNADQAAARYLEKHSARYKGTQISDDRARWIDRCLAGEADSGRWMNRCFAAEQDRDQWRTHAQAIEVEAEPIRVQAAKQTQALAKALEQLAASQALADQRQHALEKLDRSWQSRFDHEKLQAIAFLEETEHDWAERNNRLALELRRVRKELDDLHHWFAWRALRQLLDSYPMRRVLRPAVRALRRKWEGTHGLNELPKSN